MPPSVSVVHFIYAPAHCSPRARPFSAAQAEPISKVSFVNNEPEFRWALLEDAMAFDKLHEGIKKFAEDGQTLKNIVKKKIQGA